MEIHINRSVISASGLIVGHLVLWWAASQLEPAQGLFPRIITLVWDPQHRCILPFSAQLYKTHYCMLLSGVIQNLDVFVASAPLDNWDQVSLLERRPLLYFSLAHSNQF